MPITVDSEGKFTGGDFSFESRDSENASIWPAETTGENELLAAHFEDLRKHMYLIHFPASGHATSVHGGDDFNFQSMIDGYSAAVIADSEHPDKIGFSFGSEINWNGFRWIIAGPSSATFDSFTGPSGSTEYGINNLHLFSSTEMWEAHKPPEQPSPSDEATEFFNTYYRMKVDVNLYHEYDKHAPTYEASQDRAGGSTDTYLFLGAAKEILPEQIDIDLTNDGIGNNFDHIQEGYTNCISGAGKTTYRDNAKDFKRAYVTQIDSLKTRFDPDYLSTDGHFSITYYTMQNGQFAGAFPDGDPNNPVLDPGNPDVQRIFEPQVCAAYQNQLLRLLEKNGANILLPTDNNYQHNLPEYEQWALVRTLLEYGEIVGPVYIGLFPTNIDFRPSRIKVFHSVSGSLLPKDDKWHIYSNTFAGAEYTYPPSIDFNEWELDDIVWDPLQHENHTEHAAINEIWWGCNESALEKMLSYMGTSYYDWWFDTENPYIPQTVKERIHNEIDPDEFNANQHLEQTGPNVWKDNFNSAEEETMFPHPVGTWRRTFKNSMGRVDGRPTFRYNADTNPSGGFDPDALTKTLMRPSSLTLPESPCEWEPLDWNGIFHWWDLNDEAPIRGPGVWPAEFITPDHPMPWPSSWDGEVKEKRWYGFNWNLEDGGIHGINPTRLPYFDSNGDTFAQYDPTPDCDSRPDFAYEELKVQYDLPGHGDLDAGEIALVEAHISMNLGHDPIQTVKLGETVSDDIEYFNFNNIILNQIREVLMNSRRRFIEAELDVRQFIHLYDGITPAGGPYGTVEALHGAVLAEFESVLPADPDDWTENGSNTQDLMVGQQHGYHDLNSNDSWGIGDGFVFNWEARVAIRSKLTSLVNMQNAEMTWFRVRLRHFFHGSFGHVTRVGGNFEFGFGSETIDLVQVDTTNYVKSTNIGDVQFFWLDIVRWVEIDETGKIDSTDGGDDWFILKPLTYPIQDAVNIEYSEQFDDIAGHPEITYAPAASVDIDANTNGRQFIGLYDWDLVPESVFDTPNTKGITICGE